MTTNKEINAKKLRAALQKKGLNNRQASDKIGFSHAYISMCMTTGRMSDQAISNLKKYCKIAPEKYVIGLTPIEKLITEEKPKTEEKKAVMNIEFKARMNEELHKQVKAYALEKHISFSEAFRQLLVKGLKEKPAEEQALKEKAPEEQIKNVSDRTEAVLSAALEAMKLYSIQLTKIAGILEGNSERAREDNWLMQQIYAEIKKANGVNRKKGE